MICEKILLFSREVAHDADNEGTTWEEVACHALHAVTVLLVTCQT